MLETVDLSQKLSAQDAKKLLPALQNRLHSLQQEVRALGIPVVIVIEGWDLTGKGSVMRLLTERMDPRGFRSYPIYPAAAEEQRFPFLRRFWLRLPANGEMVLFYHSWYGRVLGDRVEKRCGKKEWKQAYQQINDFERQQTDSGTLILKYWFHFSKKDQKKRLAKYAKDPFEKWQITREVQLRHKKYNKYLKAAEEMLEKTNTTEVPWTVVEARDVDFSRIKALQSMIASLERVLLETQNRNVGKKTAVDDPNAVATGPTLLDRINLKRNLSENQYTRRLNTAQIKLRELQFELSKKGIPVIIVYEGWDASGKGGNIKRLTEKLDPRWYEVYPILAPTHDEKAHHFLWRFWKRLPPAGMIGIFDRSWYGRVLVERVEGFCSVSEWKRAFQEIREFENQITLHGAVFIKFWIHISKEEQLRRFKERERLTFKRHKITEEDWRNRKKWDDYREAVVEMLNHTSTTYAPWTIVEGNCKLWARVKTIQTVIERLEERL